MNKEHPKYELPDNPHAKARYESAMKHVEWAKREGKSSEEIHAIFKRVMEFDYKNVDQIPDDEAHARYKTALKHSLKAMEDGKSSDEVHHIFNRIMKGETEGKCKHKK